MTWRPLAPERRITMHRNPIVRNLLPAMVVALFLVAACGSGADRSAGNTTSAPVGSGPVRGKTPTTQAEGNFPQVFVPERRGDLASVKAKATKVAAFDSPIVLVARHGSDRLYVAERNGLVRSFDPGAGTGASATGEPVLDITDDTTTEGERGLLGLAFSADGNLLYVSHTNADGNTRLEEYRMNGEIADPSTRREILAVEQPFANHNGGNVVLGPDGMLWLGLGDGGAGDDPGNRAQNPDTPLGKLLRIDPSKPGKPEQWALGLRNPWRFSFDRKTGDLWIGDVGQNKTEEIDFLPADTKAGTNFGWSGYEGTQLYLDEPDRVPAKSVPPVFEMSHSDSWCSVTGGVVYRGKKIPELVGTYLFGDFCKEGLHGLQLDQGVVSDQRDLGVKVAQLVSIDEDANGEVYLLSLDGGIYRLEAA